MKYLAIAAILAITACVGGTSAFAGAARESGAAESTGQAFNGPNRAGPQFAPGRLYAYGGNGYAHRGPARHHRRGLYR